MRRYPMTAVTAANTGSQKLGFVWNDVDDRKPAGTVQRCTSGSGITRSTV
jgi:hypothetical protein